MSARWVRRDPLRRPVLLLLLADLGLRAGALHLDRMQRQTGNEPLLHDDLVNMGEFMERFNLSLSEKAVSIDHWHCENYLAQLDDALAIAKGFGAEELRLPSNKVAPRGIMPRGLLELPSVMSLPNAYAHVRSLVQQIGSSLETRARRGDAVTVQALRPRWTSVRGLLQRSNLTLHSESVRITGWNGRVGNNLFQIGGAIILAKASGADKIFLPDRPNKFPEEVERGMTLASMFVFPARYPEGSKKKVNWKHKGEVQIPELVLKIQPEKRENLWNNCKVLIGEAPEHGPETLEGRLWSYACQQVPAQTFHESLRETLVPQMNATFAQCVNAPTSGPEQELLTVHLRGDDYWKEDYATGWQKGLHEGEIPCSLFQSIRERFGLLQTLIVTSPDRRHPCAQESTANHGKSVSVQSQSVWEDACALMRAKHSVLSKSTFSEFFTLISDRVSSIHHSGLFNYGAVRWCAESGEVWPGTTLNEYHVGQIADPGNATTWAKALVGFSAEEASAVRTTRVRACAADFPSVR